MYAQVKKLTEFIVKQRVKLKDFWFKPFTCGRVKLLLRNQTNDQWPERQSFLLNVLCRSWYTCCRRRVVHDFRS